MRKLLALLFSLIGLLGANYRTANFVVEAPTPEYAKQVGDAAEYYRQALAVSWLGQRLPNWSQPCPIVVVPSRGNGGSTSYACGGGEVTNWRMTLQGTPQRILDSILPHEVTHTLFASYFRRPLPRWADEGGACTMENRPEYERNVVACLKTGRGIPFSFMLTAMEYPPDSTAFYAQSHSVAQWLIEQRGRQHFVFFVERALASGSWSTAIRECYGFTSIQAMQTAWNEWVRSGRPQVGKQLVTANYNDGVQRWTSFQHEHGGGAAPPYVPQQAPAAALQPAAPPQMMQQQQPTMQPTQPGQQMQQPPTAGDCRWITGADGNVYRCCDGGGGAGNYPIQLPVFPSGGSPPPSINNALPTGPVYPSLQPPLVPSYSPFPPGWQPALSPECLQQLIAWLQSNQATMNYQPFTYRIAVFDRFGRFLFLLDR